MSRTVVQIPVSSELRDSALKMAESQGFSSLQEAMRVIMCKFAGGKLQIGVYSEPAPLQLSKAAIKRYNKMDEDIEAGRNVYTYNSVEEMLEKLGYAPDNNPQGLRKKSKKENSKRLISRPQASTACPVVS